MSYKAVGTNISSINLQSGGKVNLNTSNVNTDIYDYEEIDYSQSSLPEEEINVLGIQDLIDTYGEDTLKYFKGDELLSIKLKDATYYLTCEENNYNYYVNTTIGKQELETVVNSTAKYNALYNYVIYNNIKLDDTTMERLEKLSSIYEEYKNKLENIEPTKLSYKDEVTALLEILNQELNTVEEKIKPLQEEYNTSYQILLHPVIFNPNNINGRALETCERIRPELDALKEQRAMLKTYAYQMEHELALAPYKDMMDTNSFKNYFKTYNGEYKRYIKEMDIDAIKEMQNEYDTAMLIVKNPVWFNPNNINGNALNTARELGPKLEILNNFMYMSEEERSIYIYLLNNKGKEEADKYLKILEDGINQAKGAEAAAKFIETLDLNDKGKLEKSLANFMGVSKKGLSDGIDTFFAGIENVFINNETITASEYEKMIVLQYLKENSNYYDEIYTFNSALGNMIPSMTASAIVTVLATPAAGSVVGSSLMGLAAGGNAKHQALTEGNSLLSSWLYGIFVGGSEATLGYFLGKIPGISQTSGFTLSNLLSEGAEEFLQEWIDAGLQAVILGKDVDWASIPKQSVDSFIMGVLMAGFLNGGQAIINISINGIVREINIQKTLKVMKDNPNMTCLEAMLTANGIDPDSITNIEAFNQRQETLDLFKSNEFLFSQMDKYYDGDTIDVELSLGATASMVNIKTLQLLLLSDEAIYKFNDFDNNTDLFDSSKQAYVQGMEQYFKILQDGGFEITFDMQMRYNYIMSLSSKIHSFSDIITTPNYIFSVFNRYRTVDVEYMNNVIFNEANYYRFFQIINNQSNLANISELAEPFFAMYQQIKQQQIILDPVAEKRLSALSNVYVEARNSYTKALGQYSYYGADQHAIQALATNPASNPTIYAQMEAIAQSYFPELSKSKINKLFRMTDTKGICSYATVVNEILLQFNDNPDLFRQYFGFDMYRIENGQKVLNDELLLTDLFCFANKNNPQIIKKGLLGYKIAPNDGKQNYMSFGRTMNSKNLSTINAWIASKGFTTTWKTDVIYMTPTSGTGPDAALNITGSVQQALLAGHTLELDVFSDNNKPMDLFLYSLNEARYPTKKLSGSHSYGHSMTITGITESGDLIVSSWGAEYKIKWTELANVGLTINDSYMN